MMYCESPRRRETGRETAGEIDSSEKGQERERQAVETHTGRDIERSSVGETG